MKLSKKQLAATFMTAVLAGSVMIGSVATVEADNTSGSPEEQADITNWIANTPEQISNNMAMQHINTNNLNGTRYILFSGVTLYQGSQQQPGFLWLNFAMIITFKMLT